ncbi:biotin-dependent carboxyltransferase family protein [Gaetbulibacter aquiaggeris]|uniref:Biotin-dependent carboxyltransferase family protein n=1 Tax=Gaetbulibacter aquiaggeris TaxID=1735373 RepID=A0ABW7MTH1_9FLAO
MLEVLKVGFYDSIQDLGRVGYQQYGVPTSGVMDVFSALKANNLLGNDFNDAVMEITMTGPILKFHCNTAICITGADISPSLNGTPVKINVVQKIVKGDTLAFGKLKYGLRSYLSVLGGFKTESVMHSRSMYQRITKQFKIHKNDKLDIVAEPSLEFIQKHASIKWDDTFFKTKIINVFEGPEFDQLFDTQIEQLFSSDLTVSKNNNRMAYQLEEKVENKLEPILTSLVMPGTVQLTPDGNLIILMRDCQTTGGYPRIFQLEEKSINILAQKYLGQKIKFQLITLK